jgi:hypothetical protein
VKALGVVIAILALLVSGVSAYYAHSAVELTRQSLKQHLDPEISCHLDKTDDQFPIFALENLGFITAESVSVDNLTFDYKVTGGGTVKGLASAIGQGFDGSTVQSWSLTNVHHRNRQVSLSLPQIAQRTKARSLSCSLRFPTFGLPMANGNRNDASSIRMATAFKAVQPFSQIPLSMLLTGLWNGSWRNSYYSGWNQE